jgi:hypothetical protein
MLRPPSQQNDYDTYWSGDPALEQPPASLADDADDAAKKAHAEAKKAYANKLKVAHETGDWSALQREGAQPTKFVMKPVPGTILRKIVDRLGMPAIAGGLGPSEMLAILVRLAIVSIENLGFAHSIEKVKDEQFGQLASTKTTDMLDSIDLSIVTELGKEIRRRAGGSSPS